MTTLDDLAARVARLEQHQDLASRADLIDIRRDIADMATGIGTDLRAVRQDLATMHNDLTDIKRLLARGIVFRWPWEAR